MSGIFRWIKEKKSQYDKGMEEWKVIQIQQQIDKNFEKYSFLQTLKRHLPNLRRFAIDSRAIFFGLSSVMSAAIPHRASVGFLSETINYPLSRWDISVSTGEKPSERIIYDYMRITELPEEVKEKIRTGPNFGLEHGKQLLRLKDVPEGLREKTLNS